MPSPARREGHLAAAKALASAAGDDALGGYLEAHAGDDAAKARFQAFREGQKKREGGNPVGAVLLLEEVAVSNDFASSLVLQEHGIALWQLRRWPECAAKLRAAAEVAQLQALLSKCRDSLLAG